MLMWPYRPLACMLTSPAACGAPACRSRSIYVAMPITGMGPKVAAGSAEAGALAGAAFAIWTTTPWTIPANLAVAVNDQLTYAVVEAQVRAAPHTLCCVLCHWMNT